MEKVTIIIPTWNREKTVLRAIKSVLNQTYEIFELLICDDGSTDNTYERIKSLNNPKIKWITGNHTGLPAVTRNNGIKKSKGEWLAFLDSDDEWLPEKLDKQLISVKKTDCLAICSNAYSIDTKGKKHIYLNYNKDNITFSELINNNYVICSTALIHKSLITKCMGFPEDGKLRAIEDYAFWLRISTQTNFHYMNDVLVNYFDNPKQSIRNVFQPYEISLQKKLIIKNFLFWCRMNNISFYFQIYAYIFYISAIIKSYKNKIIDKV